MCKISGHPADQVDWMNSHEIERFSEGGLAIPTRWPLLVIYGVITAVSRVIIQLPNFCWAMYKGYIAPFITNGLGPTLQAHLW